MEVQKYVHDEIQFYNDIISFLESENSNDEESHEFFRNMNQHISKDNLSDIDFLIKLVSTISMNHKRTLYFIQKVEQILLYYKDSIINNYSFFDFSREFQHSRSLFFYIFYDKCGKEKENEFHRFLLSTNAAYYLYDKRQFTSEMHFDTECLHDINQKKAINSIQMNKKTIDAKLKYIIEKLQEEYNEFVADFESNKEIGDDDSYICQLIRKDQVEDFIIYINKKCIDISKKVIYPSLKETNSFLVEKYKNGYSLIEYAAFYGSIEIFQYLNLNNADLGPSLWLYAIHGRNPNIIHFLEEKNISPNDTSFKECFIEAVKCHHNEIAHYIKDNLLSTKIDDNTIEKIGLDYCNFSFFPDDLNNKTDMFYYSLLNIHGSFGQLLLNDKVIGVKHFKKCKTLYQLTIPSFITEIDPSSFSECIKLSHISIPSSVSSIGNCSFKYCKNLTEIEIPPSVTSIGESAFEKCESLIKISIPSSVTSIGEKAFKDCNELAEIRFNKCSALEEVIFELPSHLESIGSYAFNKCGKLKKIMIPSTVSSIGKSAFFQCRSLKEVEFESSSILQVLPKDIFKECTQLAHISIPQSVTTIEESAFLECRSLTEVVLSPNITDIQPYTFCDCESLVKIDIPPTILNIGDRAFQNCRKLKKITIPSTVTSIGNYAFSECSSLSEVIFELPSNCVSIYSYAFNKCFKLQKVAIPFSVSLIGFSAFPHCRSINII